MSASCGHSFLGPQHACLAVKACNRRRVTRAVANLRPPCLPRSGAVIWRPCEPREATR